MIMLSCFVPPMFNYLVRVYIFLHVPLLLFTCKFTCKNNKTRDTVATKT